MDADLELWNQSDWIVGMNGDVNQACDVLKKSSRGQVNKMKQVCGKTTETGAKMKHSETFRDSAALMIRVKAESYKNSDSFQTVTCWD